MAQRALELFIQELGAEHPETLSIRRIIADTESYLGNHRRALELFESVLSVAKQVLHPNDSLFVATYIDMGQAYWHAGLSDQAERSFQHVIKHYSQASRSKYPLGTALLNLGRLHNSRRLYRQAVRECRRALAILLPIYGQNSSQLIGVHECIGEALIATGDFDGARRELQRAVTLGEEIDGGVRWTAGPRFQLARALWATPSARPRARELMRTTLDELMAAEGDNRELIARMKAWLSAHGDAPKL